MHPRQQSFVRRLLRPYRDFQLRDLAEGGAALEVPEVRVDGEGVGENELLACDGVVVFENLVGDLGRDMEETRVGYCMGDRG